MVAHILAPHPPFVFDSDGSPVEPTRSFGLWDCQLFVNRVAEPGEYMRRYPRQVQHVNRLVLRAVDGILANSKEPPIIVLLGDHGPRRDLHTDSLERSNLSAGTFANLVAVLAPEGVQKSIYEGISNVNVVRAVLREGLGADLPQIPDRCYYSTWWRPFKYIDVTDAAEPGL